MAPTPRTTPSTATPTQPGEVTPTGDNNTEAANQQQAKDVNSGTTSESLLTPAQAGERTYHDSLSGRAVDANGNFTDGGADGPVPAHRIVSDHWAEERDEADAKAEAKDDEETTRLA